MKKPKNCYNDPHYSWLRVAIWLAYDCKDHYNGNPISFREMEIDHIISQEIYKTPDRLKMILKNWDCQRIFKRTICLILYQREGA